MMDRPESDIPSLQNVHARLREVAKALQTAGTIDPESRRTLAELVDELTKALTSASVPAAEVAHLADSTAHLAQALHRQEHQGLLGTARDRFEQAAVNAEIHAPIAAGLARQVIDALANLGI